MKHRKCSILLLLLAVVLALNTSGCRKKDAQNNAAYIVREMRNPYWQSVVKGIEENIDGFTLDVYDSASSFEQEANNIIQVIDKGYQCVFFSPAKGADSIPHIEQLLDAGIYVVLVGENVNTTGFDEQVCLIGLDNYDAGFRTMEALAEEMDGMGSVLMFNIRLGNTDEMVKGAHDCLVNYPDIAVAEEYDMDHIDTYYHVSDDYQSAMDQNKDICGVWFTAEMSTEYIIDSQLINADGEKPQIAGTISYFDSPIHVENGDVLCVIVYDPYSFGEKAAQIMTKRYKEGKEDFGTYLLKGILVTKENIDQYKDLPF
ncbi:MAG: sugar ABC transporter substrate-binding protein [Clostridia bacterium]|nr:sugar ABC transporter substrate-binding protein [Clostridia bacterium]